MSELIKTNLNKFSHKFIDLKIKMNDEEYLKSLTLDELKLFKKEISDVLSEYDGLQLVVKRSANSLYGSSASEFFMLVDYNLAEDITTLSQHSGIIIDIAINEFFVSWGEVELQKIKEFYPQVTELRKFTEYKKDTVNDVCVYGDTDSRYIDFEMIYSFIGVDLPPNTPDGDKELSDFVLFMGKNYIDVIISDTLRVDIDKRNATFGHLEMAHEVTCRRSIFQRKKKYILNVIFKDGKLLKKASLKVVGVELKKGEINKRMKKIISTLVDKFIVENKSVDFVRDEILKLIKYVKGRGEKDFIFLYTGVNGLSDIDRNKDKYDRITYTSEKNHLQMQVALFWYNFIEKNNLHQEYKQPFEGQKMMYYTGIENGLSVVVGVPDDVDINLVKNLPKPNWNIMLNRLLVKTMMKYVLDGREFNDKDVEAFLLNIQIFDYAIKK
jgi:DNA polymerase elongation subunit (family B)